MSRLKTPSKLIGLRRLAADGPTHLQVRVLAHQAVQLATEGALTALAHVVQQRHWRSKTLSQSLTQQT